MKDAVLVADMSKSQDVKKAVDILKEKEASQATHFPKDHRPWGWFESLTIDEKFQVKKIHVHPGASLSLQSHKYRAEHWIVVSGDGRSNNRRRSETRQRKSICLHSSWRYSSNAQSWRKPDGINRSSDRYILW